MKLENLQLIELKIRAINDYKVQFAIGLFKKKKEEVLIFFCKDVEGLWLCIRNPRLFEKHMTEKEIEKKCQELWNNRNTTTEIILYR